MGNGSKTGGRGKPENSGLIFQRIVKGGNKRGCGASSLLYRTEHTPSSDQKQARKKESGNSSLLNSLPIIDFFAAFFSAQLLIEQFYSFIYSQLQPA